MKTYNRKTKTFDGDIGNASKKKKNTRSPIVSPKLLNEINSVTDEGDPSRNDDKPSKGDGNDEGPAKGQRATRSSPRNKTKALQKQGDDQVRNKQNKAKEKLKNKEVVEKKLVTQDKQIVVQEKKRKEIVGDFGKQKSQKTKSTFDEDVQVLEIDEKAKPLQSKDKKRTLTQRIKPKDMKDVLKDMLEMHKLEIRKIGFGAFLELDLASHDSQFAEELVRSFNWTLRSML